MKQPAKLFLLIFILKKSFNLLIPLLNLLYFHLKIENSHKPILPRLILYSTAIITQGNGTTKLIFRDLPTYQGLLCYLDLKAGLVVCVRGKTKKKDHHQVI